MQTPLHHSSTPDEESNNSSAARSLAASAARYLDARLQLAKHEGSEALRLGLLLAALVAAFTTSFFVAYVFAMCALTIWIAHRWWGGSVMDAALAIAVAHFLLGLAAATTIICLTRGRRLFNATLKEFSEDRQWLQGSQTFKS